MLFLTFPLLLLLSLTDSGYAQANAVPPTLFQCQPSSNQSGLVFTPNIPDLYFDRENVAAFSTGEEAILTTPGNDRRATYIFTVPPVSDCNGTIVAIEYCFKARRFSIGDSEKIFTLLSLVHQRNRSFTVIQSTNIRASPLEKTCTAIPGQEDFFCCERTQNRIEHQFNSANYAFAVELRRKSRQLQLLKFADSANTYNTDQYQEPHTFGMKQAGEYFSVGESTRTTNRSILLLRLIIDPDVPITTQQMPLETENTTDTSNVTLDFTPSSNNNGVASSMLIGGITGAGAAFGILLFSVLLLAMAVILTRRRRAKRNSMSTQLPTPSHPHQHKSMGDMDIEQNEAYIKSTGAVDTSDYYVIQPTAHAHASDLTRFVSVKTNECYGTTTTSMDSDLLYATVEEEHNTTHTSKHGITTTSIDSDLLYATVEEEHNTTHTSKHGITTTSIDPDQLCDTVKKGRNVTNTSQHGVTTTSIELCATMEKGRNVTHIPQYTMEEENDYVIP